MMIIKILRTAAILVLGVSLCSAAEKEDSGKGAATPVPAPAGQMFSTNTPGGQAKPASFSTEMSADFIKKVMETSARIGECKKQIAERQAYLFETNPQLKAYRNEMTEMQTKINAILEADKDIATLRLNRDILWTTMPVLPKGREQQMGGPQMQMGPQMPMGPRRIPAQ